MNATTIQSDFVLHLQAQLTALQTGDRESLDLALLADEFETVVGNYRYAVGEHARIIIGILLRPYWVYGDWTELRLQRDLLLAALEDSPSLLHSADPQVAAAYEPARCTARLSGQHDWPETTPWPTLQTLLAAVECADQHYLALEQAHDPRFGRLEPILKMA
jgi:hypothetical protein